MNGVGRKWIRWGLELDWGLRFEVLMLGLGIMGI